MITIFSQKIIGLVFNKETHGDMESSLIHIQPASRGARVLVSPRSTRTLAQLNALTNTLF